jgi:hypothetical protein
MTPAQLATSAKNYSFDDETWKKIALYLLANAAGLSAQTAKQLATSAKCYCFDDETWKKVAIYLLSL